MAKKAEELETAIEKKGVEEIELKTERLIYLGPNISGSHNLIKDTLFTEMPNNMEDIFKACPEIKKLFVKTGDMRNFNKRIKEKGTYEYSLNEIVVNFIRKGGI